MTSTLRTAPAPAIPGPRRLPLIGQLSAIWRLNQKPLALLSDQYRRFGSISGLTTFENGGQGTLLAFGPEFNQAVLTNPALFHNPNLTSFGDSAFTRLLSGLVTMNGERHRQQRRLIMPAFHKQAVANYHDLMVNYTADMLDHWQTADQIDLMLELRQLILRIVSHSLFGLEDVGKNERLGNLIDQFTRMVNAPQYLLVPPLRRQLYKLSEQLEGELVTLINQKRARETPSNDVLSLLIQAHDEDGTRLTDGELIGQLAILFIAGHETTVNALAWTLILLARYPKLRLALAETLDSTFDEMSPTIEQVYGLPLLDHVIKESMRLLPPVVYTARIGVEAFDLGGYKLAKDSMVILSHFVTHRMPEIYADPEEFLPERWENLDVSPYHYLPFSAGARMCIGATFAS
ncbi:MAG: cytochrome P450, partial [Anaerolineae bacterium]|nr:cytochrome P450 [Anaerolineae bacterium]